MRKGIQCLAQELMLEMLVLYIYRVNRRIPQSDEGKVTSSSAPCKHGEATPSYIIPFPETCTSNAVWESGVVENVSGSYPVINKMLVIGLMGSPQKYIGKVKKDKHSYTGCGLMLVD